MSLIPTNITNDMEQFYKLCSQHWNTKDHFEEITTLYTYIISELNRMIEYSHKYDYDTMLERYHKNKDEFGNIGDFQNYISTIYSTLDGPGDFAAYQSQKEDLDFWQFLIIHNKENN